MMKIKNSRCSKDTREFYEEPRRASPGLAESTVHVDNSPKCALHLPGKYSGVIRGPPFDFHSSCAATAAVARERKNERRGRARTDFRININVLRGTDDKLESKSALTSEKSTDIDRRRDVYSFALRGFGRNESGEEETLFFLASVEKKAGAI